MDEDCAMVRSSNVVLACSFNLFRGRNSLERLSNKMTRFLQITVQSYKVFVKYNALRGKIYRNKNSPEHFRESTFSIIRWLFAKKALPLPRITAMCERKI